ncbi:MAG: 23S rRNA (pseudouridine(1915)-N(3))-methyltransferase RlmH [Oscillospiraceae bacterium]
MNSIVIVAVGQMHSGFLRDGFEEYSRRISGLARFETVEIKEEKLRSESPADIARSIEEEGRRILSAVSDISPRYTAAMCIEGKRISSEELAEGLRTLDPSGRRAVFIIGGSYGLSDRVKDKADLRLSMSDMTFPHQLARLMLAEQLYRACTINAGIKYHK